MEKWILIAETDCSDLSRLDEFNRWYDDIHIPDVLETPGIMNATRYENENPPEGRGRFVTTYQVETGDIDGLIAQFGEIMTEKWQQERMSDLLIAHSAAFYRRMTDTAGN
ncbi:hypothetical protein ACFLXV_01245 [Chloroflexota bacterium]